MPEVGLIVATMDPPSVLNCADTAIPGSDGSPLQVVAALAKSCTLLVAKDAIQSRVIGVYKGAVGFESLVAVFGLAPETRSEVSIPSGSRVSLRAMDPGSVTRGKLFLAFMETTL